MRRIVLALFAAVLASAQEHIPENEKNPLAGKPEAIATGKRLYEQTCQACHGGNAAGSERGPALSTGVFKHGGKDGELFLNIRNGLKGTQMPPFSGLKTEQIWSMVSYLRSLADTGARTAETVPGNPAAGETLFFGRAGCERCHAVNARGGIFAPDLSAAAALPAATIRQKLLDPASVGRARGRRTVGPSITTVQFPDGRTLRGIIRNQDTFTLHLAETTGKLHLLDRRKVTVTTAPGSFMPPAKLTPEETTDLIAYLKSNVARDLTKTSQVPLAGGLTFERLRNAAAEPHNWLSYWGDYQGTHFTTLAQITPANVKTLQTKWAAQMPGDTLLQSTPLVIDGILYT
ncbi:MAG: c-type cytochrome, partial [Acidobacteriota bacterium]